jgi:hypothetical protein
MRTLILASSFLFLVLGGVVGAQSKSEKTLAWINSNLIDEHASCYVFYMTSEEGLNRDPTKSKVNYKNITDSLINKMLLLAKQSLIKEETITAKIQLNMKDFEKQMGGDFKNYSIVLKSMVNFVRI